MLNKGQMMKLVKATNSDIREMDSAIPMALWKDIDTSLYAYAYYKKGGEGLINLVEYLYMIWVNDFLTLSAYGEYLNIDDEDAKGIIDLAKSVGIVDIRKSVGIEREDDACNYKNTQDWLGNVEVLVTLTSKKEVQSLRDMLEGTVVEVEVNEISELVYAVTLWFCGEGKKECEPFLCKIRKLGWEIEVFR